MSRTVYTSQSQAKVEKIENESGQQMYSVRDPENHHVTCQYDLALCQRIADAWTAPDEQNAGNDRHPSPTDCRADICEYLHSGIERCVRELCKHDGSYPRTERAILRDLENYVADMIHEVNMSMGGLNQEDLPF